MPGQRFSRVPPFLPAHNGEGDTVPGGGLRDLMVSIAVEKRERVVIAFAKGWEAAFVPADEMPAARMEVVVGEFQGQGPALPRLRRLLPVC